MLKQAMPTLEELGAQGKDPDKLVAAIARLGPHDPGVALQLVEALATSPETTMSPTAAAARTKVQAIISEATRRGAEEGYGATVYYSPVDTLKEEVRQLWRDRHSGDEPTINTYGWASGDWWSVDPPNLAPEHARKVSAWKLHVAASSNQQVFEIAMALAPLIVERGLVMKFAGDELINSSDTQQNTKGAVVYLPSRHTLASDVSAVVSAVAGLGSGAEVPGDERITPGVGIRREWLVDVGTDLNASLSRHLYRPAYHPSTSLSRRLHDLWAAAKAAGVTASDLAFAGEDASHLDMVKFADRTRATRGLVSYSCARVAGYDHERATETANLARIVPDMEPELAVALTSLEHLPDCPQAPDPSSGSQERNLYYSLIDDYDASYSKVVDTAWERTAEMQPWCTTWKAIVAEEPLQQKNTGDWRHAAWLAASCSDPERATELIKAGLDPETLASALLRPDACAIADLSPTETFREAVARHQLREAGSPDVEEFAGRFASPRALARAVWALDRYIKQVPRAGHSDKVGVRGLDRAALAEVLAAESQLDRPWDYAALATWTQTFVDRILPPTAQRAQTINPKNRNNARRVIGDLAIQP